jgi:hypothetical protein
MSKQLDRPAQGWGLLANGSSGRWDIAVDEALDREEWTLEIDGPQTYLRFQPVDLNVVQAALRFLESGAPLNQSPDPHDKGKSESALTIGRFGPASVSLRWDNEDLPRVFLVISAEANAILHMSLAGEDIAAFIAALRQVVEDIAQGPGERLKPIASTGAVGWSGSKGRAGNSTRQSSGFQPATPPGPGTHMQPQAAAFMADIELAPIEDVSHGSKAVWQVRLRAGSKDSYRYHLWYYVQDPSTKKLYFPAPAQDVRDVIDLSSIVKEHHHTCIYKGTHYVMMLAWRNTGNPPTHTSNVNCQMQPFTVS